MEDLVKRLRDDGLVIQHPERKRIADEIERLRNELETERMRLAACGAAALGYFEGCKDEYTSASLRDTVRLREQLAAVTRERDELKTWLEDQVCEAKDFAYKLENKTVELAACQKDAERYRWLRERHENTVIDLFSSIQSMVHPEQLDEAIDAAMKEQKHE